MDMRIGVPGLLLALTAVVMAQDAGQPARPRYVSLIGTVEKADASGKVLTIKPDKAGDASVAFDDKTQFLRLPAGETDAKKATRAAGVLSKGFERCKKKVPRGRRHDSDEIRHGECPGRRFLRCSIHGPLLMSMSWERHPRRSHRTSGAFR